jgi:hypothetical protein
VGCQGDGGHILILSAAIWLSRMHFQKEKYTHKQLQEDYCTLGASFVVDFVWCSSTSKSCCCGLNSGKMEVGNIAFRTRYFALIFYQPIKLNIHRSSPISSAYSCQVGIRNLRLLSFIDTLFKLCTRRSFSVESFRSFHTNSPNRNSQHMTKN